MGWGVEARGLGAFPCSHHVACTDAHTHKALHACFPHVPCAWGFVRVCAQQRWVKGRLVITPGSAPAPTPAPLLQCVVPALTATVGLCTPPLPLLQVLHSAVWPSGVQRHAS